MLKIFIIPPTKIFWIRHWVCAQVASKFLTRDQKENRQDICADISKQIEENPKFLDSVITVPAMRDEFSSTTQRQRGSPCFGKL